MAGKLAVWVVVAAAACGDGNGIPALTGLEVETDEDTPVELHVLDGARDPDGDRLVVTTASAGSNHRAEVVDGAVVRVTPMAEFHGTIHVTFKVSDGENLLTGAATVAVRSVNDPPVALDRAFSVHRATQLELAAGDVEGDQLVYEIVTGPAHGALSGNGPQLDYVPVTGYVGADTFTYVARDASAASAVATVELDVTLGAPPVATPATVFANEDQPLAVILRGTDPDGDPLSYEIAGAPAHGALTGVPPNVVYTPAANFSGSDAFGFRVSDGTLTAEAVVTLEVAPVNDAPVATPQTVATAEDTSLAVVMQATDVEGSTLVFGIETPPAHGTITGTGSTRTYTPAANYHGPDSFTFVASDGATLSAPATVAIAVTAVPDPPVAVAQSKTLAEDGSTAIALVGSDGDGDPVTLAIAQPPAHGTLTGTPPSVTYTPDANFHGGDAFTFTASSNTDTSVPATVTLTVQSVNDAPVATGAAVSAVEDTPLAIALQATDVDGDVLTFSILSPPSDGTLTGTGSSRTYTPAPNATGTRSFEFRVTDGFASTSATVTITIAPVDDPPTARDDYAATDPDHALTIDLLRNDTDIEGDPVALASVGTAGHGTVAIVGDDVVYTPAAGFTGIDTFTYTAMDPDAKTATATVHVGVGQFPPGAPRDDLATIGPIVMTSQPVYTPAISGDGRYVAFASPLALLPEDTNGAEDVYVFDRGTRTLELASVATDGASGNGVSVRPHLSDDGRYVVFHSFASNLIAGDTNARVDVFRRDRATGTTIRVSVATGGGQASNNSTTPSISADGNLVAFLSFAFDLVPDDANGAADVFVRDIAAGTTTRVSVGATGNEGDLSASDPAISADGRFVAFASNATNLVAGDTNGVLDVFVRNRIAGTTERVSVGSTGAQATALSKGPSISADGRFVTFVSNATDLVPGVTLAGVLYARDLTNVTTTAVVSDVVCLQGRLSGDGRYAACGASTSIRIRDRFGAVTATPTGAATMMWPVVSGNGRYIVVLDSLAGGRISVLPNPL